MRREQTTPATPGTRRPLAWCTASTVAMLVLALVPLLLISRYNHSYADDWHYAMDGHLALVAGGGLPGAIAGAWAEVVDAWWTWQGTYTAIFLMALEPGLWGERLYVLAAPLVMACLIASTALFFHVVIRERLGGGREAWVATSCVTVLLQLLLQPSPVEGIFWYNSAVYYTFFHSLMLVFLAVVLRALDPGRAARRRRAVVCSAALAFLLAGGNFVTVLVAVEATLAILLVVLARRPREAGSVLPGFLMLAAGFAFSMAAPGNVARQATQFPEDALGAWETIWRSCASGFDYLGRWTGGLVVIGLLVLLPLLLRTAEDAVARGIRFRRPLLATAASVALFASSFTPTYYSMGTVGPGRVQNCRFDLLVVLLVLDVLWWCGALARRRADSDAPSAEGRPMPHLLDERAAAGAMGLAALVLVASVAFAATDESLAADISSLSALDSLLSGQAARYDEQVWDRIETIESSREDSLVVAFYEDVPHVLLMGDIRDNMDNYVNYRLAQWYGKESIVASHSVAGSG